MGSCKSPHIVLLLYVLLCSVYRCFAIGVDANQTANLLIDASQASARPISDTLFGIFFEVALLIFGFSSNNLNFRIVQNYQLSKNCSLQEINHAGAGGVWAELVSNRGYFQTF